MKEETRIHSCISQHVIIRALYSYGTFATGGCDGQVNVWDYRNKKRTCQYKKRYPTSIASLAFSPSGDFLAIAASYTFEQGEKETPADSIHIRTVKPNEVMPKKRKSAK